MLALAGPVLFLVALVRASEFPLQPRSGPCDSSGPDYSKRVCGDICLPVGQFCCGNFPASNLLYACPIGTVCGNPLVGNSYQSWCCEADIYTPPIGATGPCQEVFPFPSTSYIPGTATAPITAPSSTACGAEVNAEGYGYRACGDVCLDVEHICCGFILGTNQAWSCEVSQSCLTLGGPGITPGSCVDGSGYIVDGTIFVASNTTVESSPPSTTTTSMISSSTPSTTSRPALTTTTSTISSSKPSTTSTISSPTPSTTTNSGLTTSSTSSSTITSKSASITAQNSSSSTTSQLLISTTSTVAAGSSSLGTVTSSPSQPAFTGAATRHALIESGVIYALGGLILGAVAGDLGLF